jgi:glucose/arabinose dehydrogenase
LSKHKSKQKPQDSKQVYFQAEHQEHTQQEQPQPKKERKINPADINVPEGYEVGLFASSLTTPINLIFTDEGDMLIADAGVTSGNGKVLKYNGQSFEVIAEGFNPPLTGINYYKDNIYVSHRGFITVVKPDGSKEDIISGLPSFGDHHNNQVIFGPDGKMYFGQGSATNSGVVGTDNSDWIKDHPFFHDYPSENITLMGQNFYTKDHLTASTVDCTYTGAFSPFGVASFPGEVVKGITKATGSILKANPDGTQLELVAWGLRNPFRMKFDKSNHLFSTSHGMDVRGSRPIANSPDEFQFITPGTWYGWPDFTGGYPVTLPIFKPDDKAQPTFLLAVHPMRPTKPFANFIPHSAIMGFDFDYNKDFDGSGDAFIAEFGSMAPRTTGGKPLDDVGHKVSRINMSTGQIKPFAVNKSGYAASHTGGGGLERPIDVIFDKKGIMYVVDFGMTSSGENGFVPGTGVIWTIKKV